MSKEILFLRETKIRQVDPIVLQNMARGGFPDNEIKKFRSYIESETWNSDEEYYVSHHEEIGEEFFAFLFSSAQEEKCREFLLRKCLLSGISNLVPPSLTVLMNDISDQSKKEPLLITEFEKLVSTAWRWNPYSEENFVEIVRFGGGIMRDKRLFKMFDNESTEIIKFMDIYLHRKDGTYECYGLKVFLNDIWHGKYSNEFLDGFSKETLLKINKEAWGHINILNDRVLTTEANRLLKSVIPWEKRLDDIAKTIIDFDYPLVSQQSVENNLLKDAAIEFARKKNVDSAAMIRNFDNLPPEEKFKQKEKRIKDLGVRFDIFDYRRKIKDEKYEIAPKEVLAQIKRRESYNHPLISLGIAKTVGYEIEFPRHVTTVAMQECGLFEFMDFAGVRQGYGSTSEGAYEFSPGPFWDPETANAIFRICSDLGALEPEKYSNGFTFHFNVGISPNDEALNRFSSVIRTMYLTGIPYNPHRDFKFSSIRTHANSYNGVRYLECKAFDVLTRHGFEWTMKAATYLSWGFAALRKQESGHEVTEYEKEIASIWASHRNLINKGLNSAGIKGGYLKATDHKEESVGQVGEQLRMIYDTPSSRYRDLRKVAGPEIKEVRVSGEVWPNIACFAKEVTDRSVLGIMNVADKVERDVIKDIQIIEKSLIKQNLINNFIKKYKVAVSRLNSYDAKVEAYEDVRKIFFP